MTSWLALEDLALLVAVAEHGGIAAAARERGMAQPNATRVLRRLERRLGMPLLVRSTRGSVTTPAGALVVGWAREVLQAHQRLWAGAEALTAADGPGLRVSASQTIAEELLPRWLAALRRERPDARVAVTVCNSHEVGRRLTADLDDLGFVESLRLPSTMTGVAREVEVARDRLVVVVAPDHPWARRTRPVPLAEFTATPLVVREPGSGTRVSLEDTLAPEPLAAPALELESNAAVRVAVASRAGPAVLSELAVAGAVAADEMRAVQVEGLLVERPLRAVWSARRPLGDVADRLVQIAAATPATAGAAR